MMAARTKIKNSAGHGHAFSLITAGLSFCLLVLAATTWTVWQQKQTTIQTASVNSKNVSRIVADQVGRLIGSLELAERKLIGRASMPPDGSVSDLRSETAGKSLHDSMSDLAASAADAYSFAFIASDGSLVLSSQYWPTPQVYLNDRDYFIFARDHPDVTDFVSDALVGKVTGQQIFSLIHSFRKSDGSFAGLLVSSIKVDYIQGVLKTSLLEAGGTITLLRTDGAMLAHYPPLVLTPDKSRDVRLRDMIADENAAPFRHMGFLTDTERLFSVTRVSGRPFAVMVSEPLSKAISAWKVQAIAAISVALMGCLATIATVILALRRIRDQHRLQLAELSLAEAEQHARFGEALDNMKQALLMFDRNSRLILSNAAVNVMFGIDGLSPGLTLFEVSSRLRGVAIDESDENYRFYVDLVTKNVATAYSSRLGNGRFISGHFCPTQSGWLVTLEDVTEARIADEKIEYMALHDPLTGLPNRFHLRTRADQELAGLREGMQSALLYLDLDDFKAVNDTLGHAAGDKLLCTVCQRIAAETRPGDVVARLGGDEFAILICSASSIMLLGDIADRLIETISEPYAIDGQLVTIGVSIGIAVGPRDGSDPEALMQNADLALYRAKQDGRGTFRMFEPSMLQRAIEKRRFEQEMQQALLNGEFELFYQPIVAVRTRQIAGFEALVRWRHPSRGLLSPVQFIPAAEQDGSIIRLGEWALNQACRQAAAWPDHIKVAVNLSPVQFRAGTLVETVENALAISGLAAERLDLEITESTMMQDTEATLTILRALKGLGVRIAMDDFGTGYSSLAYLQKFPFDKVKIDRSFVRDLTSSSSLAIVRAVTSIAASLDIRCLAEGIETEAQFRSVFEEGCDEAQGFLFSVPCPAVMVAELLTAERQGLMRNSKVAWT